VIDLVGRGLQEAVKFATNKQRLFVARFLSEETQKALNESRKVETDPDDPTTIRGPQFVKDRLKHLQINPSV
jgi:hypothetical protein